MSQNQQTDPNALARSLATSRQMANNIADNSGTAADPYGTYISELTSLRNAGNVEECTIVMAMPGLCWYRALRQNIQGEIGLSDMQTPGSIFDAKSHYLYPPKSRVLAYIPHHESFGYIIGPLPQLCDDGRENWSPFVSSGSNNGLFKSHPYSQVVGNESLLSAAFNWIGHRPFDTTALGEFGYSFVTGTGIHLDNFMAYMKTAEFCGLWMFYLDRLLRLRASNYELQTDIETVELKNDEGELYGFRGKCIYPWEADGFLFPPGKTESPYRIVSDEDFIHASPLHQMEPKDIQVKPFFRVQEYSGYLGQGNLTYLTAPLPGSGSAQNSVGLFRSFLAEDGSFHLSSAHSLSFRKQALIRVPRRVKAVEDPSGDTKYPGEEPETEETNKEDAKTELDGITDDQESIPALRQVAKLADQQTYDSEYKAGASFLRHEKDFQIPKNAELPLKPAKLDLSSFGDNPFLEVVEPKNIEVSPRFSQSEYYPTEASVDLLPDGGLVLRGGGGCEIKFLGGNIYLSCPGDIVLQSGKNVTTMAGDDLILKARNSADLSATNHDVRIKAEKNLDVVSGVSGSGRLLLENLGKGEPDNSQQENLFGEDVGTSGIFMTAKDSGLYHFAGKVYTQTGNSGDIVWDADRGNGRIQTYSRQEDHCVKDHYSFAVVQTVEEEMEATNILSVDRRMVSCCSGMELLGDVSASGMIESGKSLYAYDGHVYTSKAAEGMPDVLPTGEGAAARQVQKLMRIADLQNEYGLTSGVTWNDEIWAEGNFGSEEFVDSCGFSWRTQEQYNTINYLLPEAHWQTQVTEGTTVWEERSLTYQETQQMPYPGYEKWSEEKSLVTLKGTLTDASGIPTDDFERYAEWGQENWERTIPNNSYQVIEVP